MSVNKHPLFNLVRRNGNMFLFFQNVEGRDKKARTAFACFFNKEKLKIDLSMPYLPPKLLLDYLLFRLNVGIILEESNLLA